MALSFEFKAGLGWASLIFILMIVALWAGRQTGNFAPALLPILGWIGFAAWVSRLKK